MKPNNEVELQKIFGPMSLSSGEHFRSTEVFQIFVVGDDIYWRGGTLKIVSLSATTQMELQ